MEIFKIHSGFAGSGPKVLFIFICYLTAANARGCIYSTFNTGTVVFRQGIQKIGDRRWLPRLVRHLRGAGGQKKTGFLVLHQPSTIPPKCQRETKAQ